MKVNMLLVDDEAMLVQSLKARIRHLDHPAVGDIFSARSGEEALATLGREEIGIMVVDMVMPGMSGLDLIRAAADADFSCQFIVLSAYDDYILIRESFKAGTVDYLLKPVSNNDLQGALDKAARNIEDQAIQARAVSRRSAFALLSALDGMPFFAWKEQLQRHGLAAAMHPRRVACALCSEDTFRRLLLTLLSVLDGGRWAYCSHRDAYFLFFWGDDRSLPSLPRDLLPEGVGRFALSPAVNGWEAAHAAISDVRDIAMTPVLFPERVYIDYASRRSREPLLSRDVRNALYHADAASACDLIRGLAVKHLSREAMRSASVDALEAFLNQILNRLDWIVPLGERRAIETFADPDDLVQYILQCCDRVAALTSCGGDRDVVAFATEYIGTHFAEDIDMRRLAHSLNINYTYFSELFKRQTGETFTMRLIRARMEHAQALLGNPLLRMQDIGRQVGYNSPKHFARAFKKHVGVTPSEYRIRLAQGRRKQ